MACGDPAAGALVAGALVAGALVDCAWTAAVVRVASRVATSRANDRRKVCMEATTVLGWIQV